MRGGGGRERYEGKLGHVEDVGTRCRRRHVEIRGAKTLRLRKEDARWHRLKGGETRDRNLCGGEEEDTRGTSMRSGENGEECEAALFQNTLQKSFH